MNYPYTENDLPEHLRDPNFLFNLNHIKIPEEELTNISDDEPLQKKENKAKL